jgi:hypothetical protein
MPGEAIFLRPLPAGLKTSAPRVSLQIGESLEDVASSLLFSAGDVISDRDGDGVIVSFDALRALYRRLATSLPDPPQGRDYESLWAACCFVTWAVEVHDDEWAIVRVEPLLDVVSALERLGRGASALGPGS